MPTISILGAGNMGSALICGLIHQGHPPSTITAADPNSEKLQHLAAEYQIQTTTDNLHCIEAAQILILAVKPQMMNEVLTPLAPLIQAHKPLVISIAAGIRLSRLEALLGPDIACVRCMPNTPALIGHGATALIANEITTIAQREEADNILSAVGLTLWLDKEEQMDVVTALSGSGPAYFFLLMEALCAAAEELGLSAEESKALCLQTALGSILLAKTSSHSFSELRHQVTSPGGTTEAAIDVLEKKDLRALIRDAIIAATKRSQELG